MENKSRAREVGTGLKGYDCADFNTAIISTFNEAVKEFESATAFMNQTATAFYAAILEEYNRSNMKVGIYPVLAQSVLPISGAMAYNIGTALTEGLSGSLSTATYSFSNDTAGRYFFLSVYSTDAFYVKTLTNCTLINKTDAAKSTVGLAAGAHVLLFKATLGAPTTTSILFDKLATGTPAGLTTVGHAITAWSANQCRAIK